jgi:hypothetical protein
VSSTTRDSKPHSTGRAMATVCCRSATSSAATGAVGFRVPEKRPCFSRVVPYGDCSTFTNCFLHRGMGMRPQQRQRFARDSMLYGFSASNSPRYLPVATGYGTWPRVCDFFSPACDPRRPYRVVTGKAMPRRDLAPGGHSCNVKRRLPAILLKRNCLFRGPRIKFFETSECEQGCRGKCNGGRHRYGPCAVRS